MRLVSLIPSATEIVDFLGLKDYLVGRSHECDHPLDIQTRPICTQPKFNLIGTSQEIHDRVSGVLQTALSVYQIDTEILQNLRPTHILTQAQCEVCAVSLGDVEKAVANLTQSHPKIISLQPNVLADVWADIQRVADVLGVSADEAISSLHQRIAACQQWTQDLPEDERPTVACIEWTEPLMAAGNWVPELVKLAGGRPLFGEVGKHSPWLEWDAFLKADPDVIIFMPCGFDILRTQQEAAVLAHRPGWSSLKAAQTYQVYVTDGNQYFNRSGPRLVDSLEILAEILYPKRFNFGYHWSGWRLLVE
jgi:iron complex transport system substrate-binding protein